MNVLASSRISKSFKLFHVYLWKYLGFHEKGQHAGMLWNHTDLRINSEAQLVTFISHTWKSCKSQLETFPRMASLLCTFALNSLKCFGFCQNPKRRRKIEKMLFLQIIHNWTERQGQFWKPKQNKWRVRLPICFQIPFQGNNKTCCLQTDFPIDSAAGVILWGSRHPLCTHCGSLYTSATKW